MRAVSDTSPLLNLAIIDHLDLVQRQFERVEIPAAVLAELQVDQDRAGSAQIRDALSDGWIVVRTDGDVSLAQALRVELDAGEAEALALAWQWRDTMSDDTFIASDVAEVDEPDDDLVAAAGSSMAFRDNPMDGEDWNDAFLEPADHGSTPHTHHDRS